MPSRQLDLSGSIIKNTFQRVLNTPSGSLELYNDREQTFKCKVKIEGSQYSKVTPRLVVSSEGKNIFFEGKIIDEKCYITIPPMSNISKNGNVSLELIIDNAIMIPWNSTYKLISAFQIDAVDPKIEVNQNELVEEKDKHLYKNIKKLLKKNDIKKSDIKKEENQSEEISLYKKLMLNEQTVVSIISPEDSVPVLLQKKKKKRKKKLTGMSTYKKFIMMNG